MYTTLIKFKDAEDGHLYQIGQDFPFDGREVSQARIKELSSKGNKLKVKIIEEIEKPKKKTKEKE